MKNSISQSLEDIAARNWNCYCSIFNNNYLLYKDSLETVYAYVANRTCQQILREDIDVRFDEDLFRLKTMNISSSSFKDLFSRYRDYNGNKCSVPYSTLINILVKEDVIHCNSSYSSNGLNMTGKKYTKSYVLSNSFITSIASSDGFCHNQLYKSFNAYYPNRLLEKKNANIRKLLKEAKAKDFKEKIDIEAAFLDNCSTFGWYYGDDRLDVEQLERDLKTYIKHDDGKTVDYRLYDWFTSVSSAFRSHLTIDGNHYRELYDFNAGMFWMLSIHGLMNKEISLSESERMIDQAFFGNFYADIAELPKSKTIKLKFMQYTNSHKGELIHFFKSNTDNTIKTISRNLWRLYPEWTQMIKTRRELYKGEIGKENFLASTKIEKELYTRIESWLRNCGLKHIRRVHDAIYSVEDVPEINIEVRRIVDEYIADKMNQSSY